MALDPSDPLPFAHPAAPAPTGPQFTPQNVREIHEAQFRYRRIARAISVAKFDAWTVLVLGVLSILFSLTSFSGLLVGAGLTISAMVELKQVARLKRLEFSSLLVLTQNQIGLATVLMLYALYNLYVTATGPSPLASLGNSTPEVQDVLKPYEGLVQTASYAVYVGLIVIAILAQGGMALYYWTRRKFLADYIEHTPPWLIGMQRTGMTL